MNELQPGEMRIGDAERENALHALGEHMSVGRLDVEEYGERSARVSTAKTRDELRALFTDLPEPHPRLETVQGAGPAPAAPSPDPPAGRHGPPARQVLGGVIGASWIVAIALISVTHVGQLIFIPIALSVLCGSVWGGAGGGRSRRHHRDRGCGCC